ncbi:MAG: hypothetical protein IPG34_19600 [Rhodocyclaceae bacterium]|nr:hypothetical protein [Rhodocyclaceae bacterium]
MDPNETLKRIRMIVKRDLEGDTMSVDDFDVLVDLVNDLDEWMSRGGFPPTEWVFKITEV